MLHPLYGTVLAHPELVGDHLANYGALIKEEVGTAGRGFVARAIAAVVAAVSAMLALTLIGVALMMGSLHGFHWVLVAVPGVAALVALIATFVAARPARMHGFADLRAQLDADRNALHQVARQRHE